MSLNALTMKALSYETVVHTITFFSVGIDTNQNFIILFKAVCDRHTSGINFGHRSDTIIILMEGVRWFLARWRLLNCQIQFEVSVKRILFDYTIVINCFFYANSLSITRFSYFGSLNESIIINIILLDDLTIDNMESPGKGFIGDDLNMLQRMLNNFTGLGFCCWFFHDSFGLSRSRWWSILKSTYHLIKVLVFFLQVLFGILVLKTLKSCYL